MPSATLRRETIHLIDCYELQDKSDLPLRSGWRILEMKRFTAVCGAAVMSAVHGRLVCGRSRRRSRSGSNELGRSDPWRSCRPRTRAFRRRFWRAPRAWLWFPAYKKGAFVVGAQYGQGVATCRTPKGWSAPVFVQLAGGSFGFQIGGQSTDLVLVAMNQTVCSTC